MIAYLFVILVLALLSGQSSAHGCTAAEKAASTFTTAGTAAYNCTQNAYAAGKASNMNATVAHEYEMTCLQTNVNISEPCSHCGGLLVECQFDTCKTSSCSDPNSQACNDCLNQVTSACQTVFNTCANIETTTTTLLVGTVNLNQAATDLNAQIVGASVGVLCGFTALLVLISMTGLLG